MRFRFNSFIAQLRSGVFTADRTITLPDKSGAIALDVDLTALQNRLEMNGIGATNVPASVNTAATITIASPGVSLQTVLSGVSFSYDASAATAINGTFTITAGATVIHHSYVTSNGAAPFIAPLLCGINTAVVLTLSAVAGYRGSVSCVSRTL